MIVLCKWKLYYCTIINLITINKFEIWLCILWWIFNTLAFTNCFAIVYIDRGSKWAPDKVETIHWLMNFHWAKFVIDNMAPKELEDGVI